MGKLVTTDEVKKTFDGMMQLYKIHGEQSSDEKEQAAEAALTFLELVLDATEPAYPPVYRESTYWREDIYVERDFVRVRVCGKCGKTVVSFKGQDNYDFCPFCGKSIEYKKE